MPLDRSFPDNWRNGLGGPISPCGWEPWLDSETRDVTWNANQWEGPLLSGTAALRSCIPSSTDTGDAERVRFLVRTRTVLCIVNSVQEIMGAFWPALATCMCVHRH